MFRWKRLEFFVKWDYYLRVKKNINGYKNILLGKVMVKYLFLFSLGSVFRKIINNNKF